MGHNMQIENSIGLRILKPTIQQAQDRLLISSEKQTREGWEQQFNPLGDFSNEFDKDEWEW